MEKIQSIRGMNDLLPQDASCWQYVESVLAEIAHAYGYGEIRPPMVESTQLFKRSIGEVTDVIEKEMYTFDDNGGDSVSLRPEVTAGCVRAMLQSGQINQHKTKLWYIGPVFRYERPQKGRYRQFHQFGVEAFGWSDAQLDAEVIALAARIWKKFGLKDIRLEINTIGTLTERNHYKEKLVEYFQPHFDKLDADSQVRLYKNPLRILDSKNPDTQVIVKNAPAMYDYLGEQSQQHFEAVKKALDQLNISYTVNPILVRGLDYYSHTVFEWITDQLGAQSAVCAGGRYDGLVEQLGGKAIPAVGFAVGMERLIELIKIQQLYQPQQQMDAYIIADSEAAMEMAMQLAEQARDANIRVLTNIGGGSMKAQFKRADQSGADYAVIIGERELESQQVTIKPLRSEDQQVSVAFSELVTYLNKQKCV